MNTFCKWKDTGKVNMLSTIANAGVSEIEVNSKKREIVKPSMHNAGFHLNLYWVFKLNKFHSTYPYYHQSMKLYQKIWYF